MMNFTDANKDKCCCNCKHNIRKRKNRGIETYCDIDNHYIGYADNFLCRCEKWEDEEWQK